MKFLSDKDMAMKNTKNIIKSYSIFLIGLFIASLGVAFSTKAALGTSPVSSIPYSVSLISDKLSFGGWLNVLSMIQITVQVLLLRKACKPLEILIQIVLAFVYGYLTNFSCYLLRNLTAETYVMQFTLMILSCFILAFGIWLQLLGGVAMLPGEAMNRAIAKVAKKKYENVKIFFDVLYILISAILCLVFLGKLEGVREGSVIAAVLVGVIIKAYNYLYKRWMKKK